MTERALNSTLKTSLKNEDPFLYCHLIKFERALSTQSFKPGETASDYAYISDASFDISFDDGSSDIAGNSNGAQIYRANRVKKVGTVSETTEAKVSNISINIATESINTSTATGQTLSFATAGNDFTVTTNDGDDFLELGFLVGDKITVKNLVGATTNHNLQGVITAMSGTNTTITVEKIGTVTFSPASSTQNFEVQASPDEVTALLTEELESGVENTSYAGYINREVFIYKAHIDPSAGTIIGAPYLLFKGIINKAKLVEDPNKSSQITWTLSSHWGDFNRVTGRITSDAYHRAISGNGQVDTKALIRPEYASDLGFMHAEKAINIISVYQVMETRYRLKSSGLFGLKKRLVPYEVEVDRDVDLRFNLQAKHLPVVYGVQRVDSIPIFADTRKDNSAEIYAVYAICEGEISGLYDIIINGQSRVCTDANDESTRGDQNGDQTIYVVCKGRADRGDTIEAAPAYAGAGLPFFWEDMGPWTGSGFFGLNAAFNSLHRNLNATPNAVQKSEAGVTHEMQHSFQFPIDGTLVFHAGRPFQKADDLLVGIANDGKDGGNGFKLQADLADNKGRYWTTQHRLLDTAYAVCKYTIAEGDIEIPELDFVVRGKEIEQYNYDYSYTLHSEASQNESAVTTQRAKAAFKPGSKVDIYAKNGSGSKLADSITIMDTYEYKNAREVTIIKFRFSADPLGDSTATEFRMVPEDDSSPNTTSDYLEFMTHDHSSDSGDIAATLEVAIGANATSEAVVTATSVSGGTGIDISVPAGNLRTALSYLPDKNPVSIAILDTSQSVDDVDILNGEDTFQVTFNTTSNKIENVGNTQKSLPTSGKLVLINVLKLASSAEGSTDEQYSGQKIQVSRTLSDGSRVNFLSEIAAYDASDRLAFLGEKVALETSNTTPSNTTVLPSGGAQAAISNTTHSFTSTNLSTLATGVGSGTSYFPVNVPTVHKIPPGTKIVSVNTVSNTITFSQAIQITSGINLTFLVGASDTDYSITPAPGEFIAKQNDSYTVFSENGDKKVSINPAIQLLDFLTNERYGRGLDIDKDINLDSFKDAARQCDTRSEVTLLLHRTHGINDIAVGEVYKYEYAPTSRVFFQATVKSKTLRAVKVLSEDGNTVTTVDMIEVVFTDCIGKLITKWEDWKTFEAGQLMWKVHQVTTGDETQPFSKLHIAQTTSYNTLSSSTDVPVADASDNK